MKYFIYILILLSFLFAVPEDHFKIFSNFSNTDYDLFLEYEFRDGPVNAKYTQYTSDYILRVSSIEVIKDKDLTYYLEVSAEDNKTFNTSSFGFMAGIGKNIYKEGGMKDKVSMCANIINYQYVTSFRNKFEYKYYNTKVSWITYLYPELQKTTQDLDIKYEISKKLDFGFNFKSSNSQFKGFLYFEPK